MWILPGNKFAAIALTNASSRLSDSIELGEGVSVHPVLPFRLTEDWDDELGTSCAEEIRDADLVFLATRPSDHPEIHDAENAELREVVGRLFRSIALIGVPHFAKATALLGANRNGSIEVRELTPLDPYRHDVNDPRGPLMMEEEHFRLAEQIAGALALVATDPEPAFQFKNGLRAFFKGLRDTAGEDRLLQFVRAVDGLLLADIGQGKRLFQHRCQTFCGSSEQIREVLGEIYALRSKAAHARGLEDLYPELDPAAREHQALHRLRQAEALARHAYREILRSPELLEHFRTTEGINAFWCLDDGERARIWKNKIDLLATP